MSLDISTLLLISISYLMCLFAIAYLTEQNLLPQKLIQHPLLHTLALGVYASAWTFYGAFGVAAEFGYTYLLSYLGATAAFILSPLILIPILRITHSYQLSSLADLFAFRFRSGGVGTLTTLLMLIATLPLLAIQIQAVTDSVHMFNDSVSANRIAIIFCAIISLFAILFGARHPSLRSKHRGLMVAIALESLVKLIALLTVAFYAYFVVLGGPSGLSEWLALNPDTLQSMQQQPKSSSWRTLLITFFAATLVMPHMFYLAFSENASERSLYTATWLLPLFLMLLALTVPPILWAGIKLNVVQSPEYVVLMLGQAVGLNWLSVIAFIGGLSAASGVLIVATVALSSMLQNHIVLPLVRIPDSMRLYTWLLWLRRLIIIMVMLGAYLVYSIIANRFQLSHLGIIAFIAFLQFLPGLLVTLYWQGASRFGFLLGLCSGVLSWFASMLLPALLGGQPVIDQQMLESWYLYAILSLTLNVALVVIGSLLLPPDADESEAAAACILNTLHRPPGFSQDIESADEFYHRLSPRLGAQSARREVNRALQEIALTPTMQLRPLDALRLRNQLENNLSGLLGPVEAAALLRPTPLGGRGGFRAREIHLLEEQLENYNERLSGLAAELDQIRRYHRITLQRLPIGVCTLDAKQRILFWNRELERHTGVSPDEAIGARLTQLPEPWSSLLGDFADLPDLHQAASSLQLKGMTRWFSLHKARLDEVSDNGMILLVEDDTEHQIISNRLSHSERLASIGRFAAGVAHEIGNPVTGIACLAQNLKLETDEPDILETGDQIVAQTHRISRIVQSLVRFAHTGQHDSAQHHEAVSLHDCAQEAIELIRLNHRNADLEISNEIAPDACTSGDPQQLQQVFVNLLNNAYDASPEGGRIILACEENINSICITITDEGSGISEEHLHRLFEPFFTTKEPGKGTGLGLALVYNIITEHYGSIELISPANKKQNKGTQVVITLPRLPDADTLSKDGDITVTGPSL
ncbi:sensor histidine kinase [Nitrincola alkalilacustris]|uniref:sensor histidine kinase n=1 Tax=Nitrincola alkalilacustris TaxID=1571224 RepID=UPI00124C2D36|nr:ATP-binding protein [Nitrincola alkalilacustris]